MRIILDRLLRNNLLKELTFERAVDDTVDFLEIMGIPVMFEDKYFEGRAENYRLELPCDIGYIKQVLIDNKPVREATDTFHNHYHCMCIDRQPEMIIANDLTMTIENNYLFTSIPCCNVKIAYKGIKTDEDGYPMIPDHRAFLNALEKYVETKYIRIQWQNGRVADKIYQDAEQQYNFAAGQCETALRSLELPKAEALFNSWRTLLNVDNHFAHRFKDLGIRQLIRKH